MGASARIREFQERDAEALVSLWQRCGLTRPWNEERLESDEV